MSNKVNKEDIVSRECIFAFHIPQANTKYEDVHIVKERLYLKDGTKVPNLRFIKNYERPFWITKSNKQDHYEKKEYEDIDNLIELKSTESKLRDSVAYALGKRSSKEYLRQLCNSPYVYGADIPSESIIKYEYRKKYPNFDNVFEVAILDTETDVLYGTNDIILITVLYNKDVYTIVTQSFIKGIDDVKDKERVLIDKYLSDKIDTKEYNFELIVAESSMEAIRLAFKKIHEWKPDFLTAWNSDFDIKKIVEVCQNNGVDPKDVFSDPEVPKELRYFKYKQGSNYKITASGKRKSKTPAEMWNIVYCTSSFYIIDAMSAYKYIRLSKSEEPSYALDAILNKELKIGKLKFDEAKVLEGSIDWHKFMQKEYPLEYIVYNRFDCISMQLLDEKTSDLRAVVPTFSGLSSFANFNSQPKLIANALFYFLKEQDKILATVGAEEPKRDNKGNVILDFGDYTGDNDFGEEDEEEGDNDILGLRGWIVTLQNALIDETTAADCIEENVLTRSSVRTYVYDCDCISSYPSNLVGLNISKGTTSKEIVTIVNKDGTKMEENIFKKQNINLTSGHVNAIEYAVTMFNFPTPDEMLRYVVEHNEK